mmetsp:Transcript_36310/g.80809  ORF Transcript_36310/g.80809 Transcript_36310/m.80809 type:complete len:221 (+) Transcript_36310:130-792(+)
MDYAEALEYGLEHGADALGEVARKRGTCTCNVVTSSGSDGESMSVYFEEVWYVEYMEDDYPSRTTTVLLDKTSDHARQACAGNQNFAELRSKLVGELLPLAETHPRNTGVVPECFVKFSNCCLGTCLCNLLIACGCIMGGKERVEKWRQSVYNVVEKHKAGFSKLGGRLVFMRARAPSGKWKDVVVLLDAMTLKRSEEGGTDTRQKSEAGEVQNPMYEKQ